jgi:hypothetical protein
MFILSCLSAFLFCAVGVPFHLAAKNRCLEEFRDKGFLRPPEGLEWFTFLFRKHYIFFNDPRVRLFFTISHFCLWGVLLSLLTVLLLFGSELLLGQLSNAS